MKKLLPFICIVLILVQSINVFADTSVTVENTFADVCFAYTSNDFLSTSNYNNYFLGDNLTAEQEGIKYSVYSDIFVNNGNSNFGSNMWTLLKDDIDNNMQNIGNTYFHNVDGYRFSYFRYNNGSSGVAYFNCVAVGSDDLAIVQNTICSKSDFVVYDVKYNDQGGGFNGTFTFVSENTSGNHATLSNGIYKYVLMPQSSNIRYLYSEMPLYLTYSYNSDYSDLSYLANSPYNYDDVDSVYNAIGSDETGFVIDRRTEKMINGDNSEDNLLNDVDLMQFEGNLGFEYFDFKGYITENQGLIFPNYIVNYKLNNYTDLRKNNIEIYADYSFDFKLTFQMAGNQMYGYQSANMGTMGFMDMLPVNQNTYGMDLNAYMDDNTFVNYRETSGLHLQSNGIRDYENIQNFNSNSMIADFGRYFYQIMNNVSANKVVNSKRDSYFYITCEFWIEYVDENGRRTQSDKIIRKIDYWGDSSDPSSNLTPVVTDIDSSGIIDDKQAYHDFIDSYNYKKINDETDGYLNYLPSTSNSSNQSSVGDITIYQNPYPYVLVDIPENEWMNYTPNLKMILTDFKTMLAETKEGSVLNMLPATYNYFPAPFMQYMLYGIGIIIMIGIWRAITRR